MIDKIELMWMIELVAQIRNNLILDPGKDWDYGYHGEDGYSSLEMMGSPVEVLIYVLDLFKEAKQKHLKTFQEEMFDGVVPV
jgi:hypothetical protein